MKNQNFYHDPDKQFEVFVQECIKQGVFDVDPDRVSGAPCFIGT